MSRGPKMIRIGYPDLAADIDQSQRPCEYCGDLTWAGKDCGWCPIMEVKMSELLPEETRMTAATATSPRSGSDDRQ